MKVLFVGHGRCGKDVACETLAAATGWVNAGTTSKYLAEYVATALHRSHEVETVYAERHDNRDLWRRLGDEMRQTDQALLVRKAFAAGDISGGCRGLPEIREVQRVGLADVVIWVHRPGNPIDPTMEFGPEEADIILLNEGSLEKYKKRVQRLGRILGGY